jgi:chemotaxis protein methyltransferase CheR
MRPDAVPEALWPRLSALIAEKTGLHFPPERRVDLQRGLHDAAAELGFSNSASCAQWLLSSQITQPQLHTLASHLTIGETYFFREQKTFEALATRILPELITQRRGREQRLRLWSAACSTGEEAYSLAILLQQLIPDWDNWRITILATDINPRFLQKAVAGVYGEWSFRDSPPELKERYFKRVERQRFALLPEIRNRVTFSLFNLAQDRFPSLATDTNAMDVILCRNVLIYFSPAQASALVENLRHALVDDGWLAVSPSECSQELFPRFQTVNFPGAILYRKAQVLAPPPPTPLLEVPQLPVWPQVSPPAPAPVRREFLPSAEACYAQGCYAEAAEVLLRAHADAPGRFTPQAFSLLTRSLANQGRLRDALTWSERWTSADKLDAAAHYLHAMVQQELGVPGSARLSLQRAIYLQPEFVLAHVALGNLAASSGGADAKRHFGNALGLLRALPPTQPVPESDGLTAGRLTEIVAALLTQATSR